ncbi:GDSL esterase/lipase [Thalictrum thalictroides]|uniref:GDSL esterase/lipase n=1 Tax=Thalictrum thalictroides TaxID=46969 RepID=A0A7J6WFH9_THATH|nr:GDSL esterase/lipase [Thalictrum thalictroides]
MAKKCSMPLLLVSIFIHSLLVKGQSPLPPALYVFGDSLSDSGNNNFLQTEAKVNYTPYGIDFPSGATGRFTNGKTIVDFLAESLGLPFVPAYLSLSSTQKNNITTGVNYASGAAGILPETGTAMGMILSLDKQIDYFKDTIAKYLPRIYTTPVERSKYLSKSIFFISIGSNDYINNYLKPENYGSSKGYTPQQFANLLRDRLENHLKKLYYLGARKFVVFNIGRLGCIPAIVSAAKPKPNTPCDEKVNSLVVLYNAKFPNMIRKLERSLSGSTFVRGDTYNMAKNSYEAGILTEQTSCCEVNGLGHCRQDSTPCKNRKEMIFWDAYHPTEMVNHAVAYDCFNGSFLCTPMNIHQLARKPYASKMCLPLAK